MTDGPAFSSDVWERLCGIVASSFSLGADKAGSLRESATAKLIASIPYEAGCREPERTALAHVAVYLMASSEAARRAFDHKREDDYDILARLATIASFEGGDPAVINRGMKTLAVLMIEGYRRDAEADKARGWYNPVGSGAWDADELTEALRSSLDAGGAPPLSGFIEEALSDGWWS